MASLWNLNVVSGALVMLLSVVCLGTRSVLAENYNSEYRSPTLGKRCENLSPQKFIEMDHVRTQGTRGHLMMMMMIAMHGAQ